MKNPEEQTSPEQKKSDRKKVELTPEQEEALRILKETEDPTQFRAELKKLQKRYIELGKQGAQIEPYLNIIREWRRQDAIKKAQEEEEKKNNKK